jgi:hypothetical protein
VNNNTAVPIEENLKNLKDSDIKLMSEYNLAKIYLKSDSKKKHWTYLKNCVTPFPDGRLLKKKSKN